LADFSFEVFIRLFPLLLLPRIIFGIRSSVLSMWPAPHNLLNFTIFYMLDSS
jgi:hypothetical protein